jgi:hypothetical protein
MRGIMIDLHPDETRTTVDALFGNAEWTVVEDGLEHRASGYFIPRDVIGMRRGDLWEWPLHLAEKTWCKALPFREAFLAALSTFGIARDAGLAPSFAIGFGLRAGPGPAKAADDFVALGDVLRSEARKSGAPRKRNTPAEGRGANRRSAMPVPQRAMDAGVQRIAL